MINTIEDVQKLMIAGETNWKQYGRVYVKTLDDLTLFNYSPEVQYAGDWNAFELMSRGLIVSRSGEIVARPFDKFFNYGEGGQFPTHPIISVNQKMDGSLGILYRHNGQPKIATRGSFDSDQARWATNLLNQSYDAKNIPNEWTLLFEIIYPGNRVVVNYGDYQDLVLLAMRNRFTGEYAPFSDVVNFAELFNFPYPAVYSFEDMAAVIATTPLLTGNEEGYVITLADGSRWKIKGDRYRELHKTISGLSFRNTVRAFQNDTLEQLIGVIPDEFLNDLKRWIQIIEARRAEIVSVVDAAFNAAPKDTRKDFALFAQKEHKALMPYLFARLDGKAIEPLIYKVLLDMPEEQIRLSE